MTRLLHLTTCILLSIHVANAEPMEYHVHPNGQDGAFATLEAARDAIREARADGRLPEGAVVRVHKGDYVQASPFLLEEQDSGTADFPIQYLADTKQVARLLGGRLIKNFRPVTDAGIIEQLSEAARPHVMEVDLNEYGVTDYGSPAGNGLEVFFNGERMSLSRWPNEGFTNIVDVTDYDGHEIHGQKGSKTGRFLYEGDRPSRWQKEEDAWLHGYWFWDWSDQRQRIKSIEPDKKTISVEPPYHGYGYRKGQWYYAYNLISELDTPGEWYLNRQSGILYFWPPEDPATSETIVSVLPNLITLRYVSHVTIQGLTLEGARNTMVSVFDGKNVNINGLTIRNGGGSAIGVSGGSEHTVEGCDVHSMGRGGISVNGGHRPSLTPGNHSVLNNHVHHYAQVKRVYQAAIHVHGVGNRVAHNYIHHAPHMAIGFGGNDHVIEFNEIHDVCLESNDAGAIYTGRNWTMRGHQIRYNYLYDINGFRNQGCVGVYLDDMFSSAAIHGNIFRNVFRAAFIGGGRDNSITNNIFVNCSRAVHIDARGLRFGGVHTKKWIEEAKEKGTISGIAYKEPPYSVRYPQLPKILDEQPNLPIGNVVSRNIFVGDGWNDIYDEAKLYVTPSDNLSNTNPDFVDAKNHDYRLKPDSPAFKLGFEQIPVEKIGLYESNRRASWPVSESNGTAE